MPECECLAGCPFFNDRMKNIPTTAKLVKQRYCLGDKSDCARYMIFNKLGREKVPGDLYPDQVARAQSILSSN